jgi:predicted RNA-binding protein YlxR (DUF448 family)
MAKEEPKRSCLGCRAVKDRKDLLRFVVDPDMAVVPDLLAKLPGRGAYTCFDMACLTDAVKKNLFNRAFRVEVKGISAEDLTARVASMMEERIASYLSLANKAGKVVSGSDIVMQVLRKNTKEIIVLLSTDISDDIRQKVVALASKKGVECFSLFDKERVGALIGKSLRSVVAVDGQGFVTAIKKEFERYRIFVGGGAHKNE